MTTLEIDADTSDRIRAVGGNIRLIDPSGKTLGEFHSTVELDPSQFLSRWFTDEEVAASLADPRRYSAAEVEQRLRELRK